MKRPMQCQIESCEIDRLIICVVFASSPDTSGEEEGTFWPDLCFILCVVNNSPRMKVLYGSVARDRVCQVPLLSFSAMLSASFSSISLLSFLITLYLLSHLS